MTVSNAERVLMTLQEIMGMIKVGNGAEVEPKTSKQWFEMF